MNTLKSGFFLVTGFLSCPCHLPLTLPLILTVTAGTAFGAFVAQNAGLVAVAMTVYFVAALTLGLRSTNESQSACQVPDRHQGADERPVSLKSIASQCMLKR